MFDHYMSLFEDIEKINAVSKRLSPKSLENALREIIDSYAFHNVKHKHLKCPLLNKVVAGKTTFSKECARYKDPDDFVEKMGIEFSNVF